MREVKIGDINKKDDLKVIVVKESLLQSIISDVITFTLLFGGFFVNYKYLGNSVILKLFIVISLILYGLIKASKKTAQMTPKQALDYLNKLYVTDEPQIKDEKNGI